jgi:hypothetical protein
MYITLTAALLVIFILPILYSKTKTAISMIFTGIILLILLLFIYNKYYEVLKTTFGYAIGGLESFAIGKNQSANIRTAQIQWAIENNKFIFAGAGIGKNVRMLESFYSLYYYRYGLIGVLLYLAIPFTTAFVAYGIAKKEYKTNKRTAAFYLSLFVYYVVSPIGMLSSCNQDTPKTAFLFYGLMGLVFHKYSLVKNKNRYGAMITYC